MPQIECPDCEQLISDASEKYVHCGYPINKKKGR